MQKRPNPFWHMMSWGLSSGFILALSYIVVLVDFANGSFTDWIEVLFSPFLYWLAFVFGGVPGAGMGFFLALALWGMLRNVPLPFTKEAMNQKRVAVYSSVAGITLFLSFILVTIFLGGLFEPLLIAPPIIAAIAATYVAHRYMYRLRLWSGGMENRKSKAKNDALAASRLVDDAPDTMQMDDAPSPKTGLHGMNERPTALSHMFLWGTGSGFLLAILYIATIFHADGVFRPDLLGMIFALTSSLTLSFALIFGAFPGAFLGILTGWLLSRLTRYIPIPFTKADMSQMQWKVYFWISILIFCLSWLFLFPFITSSDIDFFIMVAPSPFIATIAAIYSARYMYRLRLWSGGMESRKSKAKNDALAASRLSESNSPVADEILYSNREEKKEQL